MENRVIVKDRIIKTEGYINIADVLELIRTCTVTWGGLDNDKTEFVGVKGLIYKDGKIEVIYEP